MAYQEFKLSQGCFHAVTRIWKVLVDKLVPVEPFQGHKREETQAFNLKSRLMNSVKQDVMTSWMKEKWQGLLAGRLYSRKYRRFVKCV